jgi:hypothetical protein
MALSPAQVESFVADGFVRLDAAFSRDVAAAARAILWRDLGASPDAPSTWRAPVIRLGGYADPPFVEAARSPRLRAALDQLVGAGAYVPPVGTVSLCHRFLVHAAQAHRGSEPRFMGQPPLLPTRPFDLAVGTSPVERAIRDAL